MVVQIRDVERLERRGLELIKRGFKQNRASVPQSTLVGRVPSEQGLKDAEDAIESPQFFDSASSGANDVREGVRLLREARERRSTLAESIRRDPKEAISAGRGRVGGPGPGVIKGEFTRRAKESFRESFGQRVIKSIERKKRSKIDNERAIIQAGRDQLTVSDEVDYSQFVSKEPERPKSVIGLAEDRGEGPFATTPEEAFKARLLKEAPRREKLIQSAENLVSGLEEKGKEVLNQVGAARAPFEIGQGLVTGGLASVTFALRFGLRPIRTSKQVAGVLTNLGEVGTAIGERIETRGAGFVGAEIFGGQFIFSKAGSVTGRLVTRVETIGSKFVAPEQVFDAGVLAGKQRFPMTRSIPDSLKRFRAGTTSEGKIVVQTSTPTSQLTRSTISTAGTDAAKGLEDPGIFVTPRGEGSPFFLRISGEVEQTTLTLLPRLSRPRVVEFEVFGVRRQPGSVLVQPGFAATEKFFLEEASKQGVAVITKRSEAAFDPRVARAARPGAPTSEIEAVIPKGARFGKDPVAERLFTTFEGRRVPIKRFIVEGEGITGKASEGFISVSGSKVKSIVESSSGARRSISVFERSTGVLRVSSFGSGKSTSSISSSLRVLSSSSFLSEILRSSRGSSSVTSSSGSSSTKSDFSRFSSSGSSSGGGSSGGSPSRGSSGSSSGFSIPSSPSSPGSSGGSPKKGRLPILFPDINFDQKPRKRSGRLTSRKQFFQPSLAAIAFDVKEGQVLTIRGQSVLEERKGSKLFSLAGVRPIPIKNSGRKKRVRNAKKRKKK